MIISRTPFRVSLFGGGTDYPEWFLKNSGSVISFSINKYCHVIVRYLPPYFHYNYRIRFFNEQKTNQIASIRNPAVRETLKYLEFKKNKIEIIHQGDLPGLSGLGASSSFLVGMIKALSQLKNKELSKKQLAKEAFFIERYLVGDKVGFQDQVIASYGGLKFIKFHKNKDFSVNTIKINNEIKNQIENNLILVYTGSQRFSQKITKNISTQTLKNKNNNHLSDIASTTNIAKKLFDSKSLDLKSLGELMNYSWKKKKELGPGITNNLIDDMYQYGLLNGASGGKLLGAGGGGFLLFVVESKNLKNFKKTHSKHMFFNIKIDNEGSKILYSSKKNNKF